MEVRLQTSRYLMAIRRSLLFLILVAGLLSNVHPSLALLLVGVLYLQQTAFLRFQSPVTMLQIVYEQDPAEQNPRQKVIVESLDNRRIEFALTGYYCLWWLQIIYLSSSRGGITVIVMPDSCTADERRRLRQALTHQGVNTVSTASGSNSG